MISKISAKPQKPMVSTDPLFVLTELLIKIDRRERVIEKETGNNEDK